ncbi:Rab geranylgeranyltransferase [Tulasnella sp. 418]|nr:Rab geranylgeranyltransferase [Tulasnella sp. 418]
MHGVKRTRQSAEAREAQRIKEAAKLTEYKSLEDNVMQRRNAKDWSKESFDHTTRLLKLNPELYTAWNYRRDICINGMFPNSTPLEINNLLGSELQLTLAALKQHPKVYWLWNHRRWCLQNTPNGPGDSYGPDPATDINGWKRSNWARELAVVEKMLDADARNFHAWNYRRYVVSSSPDPRSEISELDYTTKKIESNFSNFSAWHQRSKLLTALWEKGEKTDPSFKDQEFELIKQAMYTDPNDQSVWLYHRWLIGSGDSQTVLRREIAVMEELLEIEPDSKWCMDCLVHYKQLLKRHETDEAQIADLEKQRLETLTRLIEIDPQRKGRYMDLISSTNMQ